MKVIRWERRGRFVLTIIGDGQFCDIHLALHDTDGFHVFAAVVVEMVSSERALEKFDEILEALP